MKGKVSKINGELGYGFIQCGKAGEVFFSAQTGFSGVSFESVKVNDSVQVEIVETDRGLFAQTLVLDLPRSIRRSPEATL